jgi:hypothetical protein
MIAATHRCSGRAPQALCNALMHNLCPGKLAVVIDCDVDPPDSRFGPGASVTSAAPGRVLFHASGALRCSRGVTANSGAAHVWPTLAAANAFFDDASSSSCFLLNGALPDRDPNPRRGSARVGVVGLLERRDRDLGPKRPAGSGRREPEYE